MENRLFGSSSPHILSNETTSKIMRDVLIALAPATLASVFFFRFAALKLIILAVVSAVATEYIMQKAMKKRVTINDYSAAVTGLLLAFNIPASAPWWIPVIGSIFAIAICKQLFGGIGNNFINPALAARAFLLASWPVIMTTWTSTGADAVTTASPLAILKPGGEAVGQQLPSLWDVFIGNIPGSLGETSAILLIVGAIYLFYRGIINWRIPFTYIGTVAVIMLIFTGGVTDTLYHLFAGGLMLGAFFMATDYSSSPVTPKGQIIFGIGCGLITAIIRLKGGYPEGVSYSILLMNVATPLIDKYTSPKVFGEVK
ncbi:electron transport complex protein, subunit D [Gottschalkia acidurici 9a]|uniref:Ion-translocating oxidoreductase complex subunit D n=1 Tax=Gottschalkia acidurici (strain ATCC 7906 / DSM 604 / BCRC 14475 / CIP 104303 / KCTC 5404 / NCIMB 10678 / 9a) TaxID=1128398 RepID=K0AYZ3_GOTA9|nr:RnfABCDGE type electron transport complex subunit D [Gottschalkia acidurici]AFS78012.1 electron transport complex protein, subunit D [Gottschalkia acidurici 9a]